MAYGFFGHIKNKLNPVFRIVFFLGGLLLLFPDHLYSSVGLALAVVTLIIEKMMNKKINLEGLSA